MRSPPAPPRLRQTFFGDALQRGVLRPALVKRRQPLFRDALKGGGLGEARFQRRQTSSAADLRIL